MIYRGKEVEYMNLVTYLGKEYKNNQFYINKVYFNAKIKDNLSFPYSFESTIDDMVIIYHEEVVGVTEEDKARLLEGLEELKRIFPNSFINFNLQGFLPEGNSIDLTGEEFRKLYC